MPPTAHAECNKSNKNIWKLDRLFVKSAVVFSDIATPRNRNSNFFPIKLWCVDRERPNSYCSDKDTIDAYNPELSVGWVEPKFLQWVGWVHKFTWHWAESRWVDENRPMDNSDIILSDLSVEINLFCFQANCPILEIVLYHSFIRHSQQPRGRISPTLVTNSPYFRTFVFRHSFLLVINSSSTPTVRRCTTISTCCVVLHD